jgi:hypothetical protein
MGRGMLTWPFELRLIYFLSNNYYSQKSGCQTLRASIVHPSAIFIDIRKISNYLDLIKKLSYLEFIIITTEEICNGRNGIFL